MADNIANTANTADDWIMSDSTDVTDDYTVTKIDAHTTTTEPLPCFLLKLPAELRSVIYSLALVHHEEIKVESEFHRGPVVLLPRDPSEKINPNSSHNLLATCRQIHDEATPIFYGLNRFAFSSTWYGGSRFLLFLKLINGSALHLRDIKLAGEFTKKYSRANLVAIRKIGMRLSKLELGFCYQEKFSPLQMA